MVKIKQLATKIEQCHKNFGSDLGAMIKAHVAMGQKAKKHYSDLSTSLKKLQSFKTPEEKREGATDVQMDLARTVGVLRKELVKVNGHQAKLENDLGEIAKLTKSFTKIDYG